MGAWEAEWEEGSLKLEEIYIEQEWRDMNPVQRAVFRMRSGAADAANALRRFFQRSDDWDDLSFMHYVDHHVKRWIKIGNKTYDLTLAEMRVWREKIINLELFLWKNKLEGMSIQRGDERQRAECRINCGSDVIIPHVLDFLLPPSQTKIIVRSENLG